MGRVELTADGRPTRALVIERGVHEPSREVFLNWDTAMDDAGRLRRCIACGCGELFWEKAFPQVTGFVIVLAFVGAILGALGLATNLPVLLAMLVVLIIDIAILVFSRRRLVCYQCRSSYHGLDIARYHRSWDRTVAERYPAPPGPAQPPHPARPPRATQRTHEPAAAPASQAGAPAAPGTPTPAQGSNIA